MDDDGAAIPEIAATLADFVASQTPFVLGFNLPLNLRAIARDLRFIPVVLDMSGTLGLGSSGVVGSVLWDEPDQVRPVDDPVIRNLVLHQARLKYPALANIAPRRSVDAVNCRGCGGSGRCLGLPSGVAAQVLCECGGLGWLPGRSSRGASWLARLIGRADWVGRRGWGL